MLFQEKNKESIEKLLKEKCSEMNETEVTAMVKIFHSSSSQTCKYLFKHIFDLPKTEHLDQNDIKMYLQWAKDEQINKSVIHAIMYLIKHSFQNYGMEVSFMIEI